MALLLFQTVAVVDRLGKNLPSVSWMYSTQGTFLDSGATEQGRFQLGRRANQILGSFHQFQTTLSWCGNHSRMVECTRLSPEGEYSGVS